MATKLILKKREADTTVSLPGDSIKEIIQKGDKNALWNALKDISSIDFIDYVHDKRWLMMIARWQPQKGLPLKQQYRAMKLIDRLDDLEEDEDIEFEITDKDKEFIINRLQSDDFTINKLSTQFIRFVFDLEKQLDHHIISPEKEPE